MSATVDLVADILCPWCYIARRRLDAALVTLAAEGLPLAWVWRPFLLDPDAPAGGTAQTGHLARRFGSVAAADRYHAGVAEAGRAVGIQFRYDRIARTPSARHAHRLLLYAAAAGAQARWPRRWLRRSSPVAPTSAIRTCWRTRRPTWA